MGNLFNRRRTVWLAALIVAGNGFFPAIWVLFTSLKTEAELMRVPITIWPAAATLDNYVRVFVDQPIGRFLWNSIVVATCSTILCVTVSALAAYALVRMRLPAPGVILSMLLAVSMFPLISLVVPLFQVMRDFGLLNTWPALILPYAVLSMPVCTLVLISFFQDIPKDLENAAMIDGCTRLGALWHVVIPLTAPGVFTAAILSFVNAWDEFCIRASFRFPGRSSRRRWSSPSCRSASSSLSSRSASLAVSPAAA
jgi:multiple sugar transport system permease protein